MLAAPSDVMAAFGEAARLQARGRFAESVAVLDCILESFPQSAEAHCNRAAALLRLEQFDEAGAAYRRTLELRPDADWALRGLGSFLHHIGRWEEAKALYQRALAVAPEDVRLQLNLGYIHLGLGEFAAGWRLYERRTELPDQNARRPALENEWRGEPLAGRRLLVWPEQGFGDQIQFARFAPVLQEMGADVTIACPPQLLTLFATLGVKVIDQSTVTADHGFDAWTMLMSIPARLGLTVETIPAAPYLSVPDGRRRRQEAAAVGIAWQGRASHPNNAHRSLPSAATLEPLRAQGATLVDLTVPTGDFAETAAVIEGLDLVISVDTAVAHLAGALGKPTWLLLPAFRQDWRWMQGRDETPWYPTMRIFRQARIGDWGEVVDRLVDAWSAGR